LVVGVWQAQISGDGSFALSTSGNSSISFEYLSDTSLAKDEAVNLLASLTGPVASASFQFVHPDGTLLQTINLFDDGLHGDGLANDGVYGGTYTPTTAGSFYFRVEGTTTDSTEFERIATEMIRVQTMSVVAPADQPVSPGTTLVYDFSIINGGTVDETYDLVIASSQGWADLSGVPGSVTVLAGATEHILIPVNVPITAVEGLMDDLVLTAVSQLNPLVHDSDSVQTTVIAPPNDLIFADGFESGNFSAWYWADTDGGDLSASVQAAAIGNYGMQAIVDDTVEITVEDRTPNNEKHYSARFYLNPNDINIASGGIQVMFASQSDFCLYLNQEGANYSLMLCGKDDAGSWLENNPVLITDAWQAVEIEWQASSAPGANDGFIKLWVGDTLVSSIENVDNDSRAIASVWLGAMDIASGASGTLYFDGFASHQGSHIGLDPNEPSVYVPGPLPDPIFADGFESGDLSGWSSTVTDGGDLSVSASAAYQSNYGLRALINDTSNLIAVDASPVSEPHYRTRFYFNPNLLTMSSGNAHFIFDGMDIAVNATVSRVELIRESGAYKLRAKILNDAYTYLNTSKFTISNGWHVIEIEWQASSAPGANNGFLTLWIDGTLKQTLSNVDNDMHTIGEVRLGATAGLDAGTSGSMYFDKFESRRNTYIGP